MYKITVTAIVALFMMISDTAEAQTLVASRNTPRIRVVVNTVPAYGYKISPYQKKVRAQQARVNTVKRRAMYDGFITRKESAMIRAEERQLARMTNGRGSRSRF